MHVMQYNNVSTVMSQAEGSREVYYSKLAASSSVYSSLLDQVLIKVTF